MIRAGSWPPTSTKNPGPTTSPRSSRPPAPSGFPPLSSAHDRETARMSGSFSPRPWRPRLRAGWAEERLILATGRYIGEGFDDARLDTLFLAMPVSWKGTLVQYTGRLHRLSPGKSEVRIYDYVDPAVPLLARMYRARKKCDARWRPSRADLERLVEEAMVEHCGLFTVI